MEMEKLMKSEKTDFSNSEYSPLSSVVNIAHCGKLDLFVHEIIFLPFLKNLLSV